MSNIFKKVKAVTLLDLVTLEGNETGTQPATSRTILETYEADQINLVCKYLVGTGESNNNAYIKVWGYIGQHTNDSGFPYSSTNDVNIKADSTKWIQIGKFITSAGTVSFTPFLFNIHGASSGETYDAHFSLGITWPKIRISAYEEGVLSNKGRLSCVALIQ